MDKKRSILNVTIAIATKIILLLFSFLLRKLLIKYAGNDANGVYSLYTSILGFLAIADLGVGTAINFSMYKPIVEGDNKKVAALYNLYKKVYFIIGAIILVAGLVLMPALPILAKDYSSSFNLYLTFGIMLVAVVIEYVYSCKTSLINAYKNNYITTLINSICVFVRRTIQLLVLIFTGSFELYLTAKIVATLLEWALVEIYTRKHYKDVINTKEKVDAETKAEVMKNTKAMFMHKIGYVLVNTADSIIISAFIGVVILGKYSNYLTIMTAMTMVLGLFFSPLTAIIGHLFAEGNIEEEKKYFRFLYYFNFAVGIIFFLGYYAIIDNIIPIFGPDLIMERSVPLIITINYFIQFMRQTVLLYRDASGAFYNDRWKPLIEGIVNIALSIAFVYWLGIVGVIVATIITNVLVCHVVEPFILYKYGFKGQNPTQYYLLNYSLMIVFVGALFALHFSMQHFDNNWIELLVNGCIAVAIALVPIICLYIFSPIFRTNTNKLFKKAIGLFKRKPKAETVVVNEQLNQEPEKSSQENAENVAEEK